ncbi:hypothetical protein Tco_1550581, partial [Tanacetum coccineum]
MSGTHLVAWDYRWGKNPLRSFPNEYSSATSRWRYLSPATCRWGKPRHVAREKGDCRSGSSELSHSHQLKQLLVQKLLLLLLLMLAKIKVDSLVRSAAPVMTEATIVATPADVSKDKSAPHPSVFCSSSSSKKTDRTLSLFTGRSGSGFDARSIRAEEAIGAGSKEIYVTEWTVMGVSARNLTLSSEVRMRAEYNILEKRKWRTLAKKKNTLLEAKNKEIEDLKSQLLRAREESAEVTQLLA